jgi:hypothetical protein
VIKLEIRVHRQKLDGSSWNTFSSWNDLESKVQVGEFKPDVLDSRYTVVEQVATLKHLNPLKLECGASGATINFMKAPSKGVGGLHLAEVQYLAFSYQELLLLRNEAYKRLGAEVIKLDEMEPEEETDPTTLERAHDALRVLLTAQRRLLENKFGAKIDSLYSKLLKLETGSRFGNRKSTIMEMMNAIARFDPWDDPQEVEGLDMSEASELFVHAWQTEPESFDSPKTFEPDSSTAEHLTQQGASHPDSLENSETDLSYREGRDG